MRRILAFHEWEISWWKGQIGQITNGMEIEQEGLIAYALRQANIRQKMRTACIEAWKDVISDATLSSSLSSFN